jgi:hypothetical protein
MPVHVDILFRVDINVGLKFDDKNDNSDIFPQPTHVDHDHADVGSGLRVGGRVWGAGPQRLAGSAVREPGLQAAHRGAAGLHPKHPARRVAVAVFLRSAVWAAAV